MSIETDKLIAEFMGNDYDYLVCDNCGMKNPKVVIGANSYTQCCAYEAPGKYGGAVIMSLGKKKHIVVDLKYSTDWNWLLPVVHRLCAIDGYKDTTPFMALRLLPITASIGQVYNAVVTAIQFYNLKEGK